MSESFETSALEDCVRRHRPGAAGRVRLARVPTGKFNTSYFVEIGAERMVLRIAPPRDAVFCFYERDMMRQEPGIHRLLREKTSVPVAEILAYDDSHSVIDRDFILMERLPGEALSQTGTADVDAVMRRVGECLAETHRLTAERYGYIGEHAPMKPQATWNDAFVVMWRALIEDVVSVGHYTRQEADLYIALLDQRLPLFRRQAPSSLLHMDVWAQNILVDGGGRLTGLVDWDRALWGDPEIEFAVLDYCGVSTPAFWEGYGQERDESPEARVRAVFYLLYELQKYIVIRQGRQGDRQSALSYKRQVEQIIRRFFFR